MERDRHRAFGRVELDPGDQQGHQLGLFARAQGFPHAVEVGRGGVDVCDSQAVLLVLLELTLDLPKPCFTPANAVVEFRHLVSSRRQCVAGQPARILEPLFRGGIRTPRENAGKSRVSDQSGAESGALAARKDPLDPELAAVVDAWPALPEAMKASILAMIGAVK